jgi:tryptophanyl-tRNA synthetase
MKESHRIVAGIRATGKLHIGNYLGALKQFVELQNAHSKSCYFFIADLHAITTPFKPEDLKRNTLEVAAEYLAAGIDPEKSVFFLQSQVLEHSELAWIFNCITPLGELQRMTQFKDKLKQHKENINAGLLTYPALMAADILIYKPMAVPVGEDQVQHVELARTIARRFNGKFGQTFPELKTSLRNPLRIMSLTDPKKKMSKTGDEALMMDDEPLEITRKLKKAVTATDASKEAPGVDNLMLILKHFADDATYSEFERQQKANTIKYSDLKTALTDLISTHFAGFRDKKQTLMAKSNEITEILFDGSRKAQKIARETLNEVKEKMGLV